ncbi:MAG: hypothetical protein L3J74_04255 [Bacteroidales bacterium]|nr:hypothetical protein [Bacteroidales bacterium]
MGFIKKVFIAAGTIFGLALSLSLMQRKTLILSGRVYYSGNRKFEEAEELKLDTKGSIRKISGNNQGFILYKDGKEILKSMEQNAFSMVGTKLENGVYKVLPLTFGGRRPAHVIIEIVI